MDLIMQDLAGYPRWLVALGTVVAVILVCWVIAKLLKWTIYLFLALTAASVIAGVILWWLG